MAKRIKAGQVEIKVANSDQDGNTIQFQAKFKPKQYTAMLTSKNGLCVSKNGKNYIRFEDSDELQVLLNDIQQGVNDDFKKNLASLFVKIKCDRKKKYMFTPDVTNSFSADFDGVSGLILYPGKWSKFKAYSIDKFVTKDAKSKDVQNYGNCTYRVTVSVGTVEVTIADDELNYTFYLQPYINVNTLTLCLKKGQKPYDPDVVQDGWALLNKEKELKDLKSFFSGGSKKVRLGFTDTEVVKLKDPNIFSDVDDEEEEGYEPYPPKPKSDVVPPTSPKPAPPTFSPPKKKQKKSNIVDASIINET